MQSIFAYEQCKESNYNLALESIRYAFEPDLNSMEFQDKVLLKEQAKATSNLFKKHYKNRNSEILNGNDVRVNNTLNSAITTYFNRLDKDKAYLKKQMIREAEQVFERFAVILSLPGEFVRIAQNEQARKGNSQYDNFVNNLLIKQISEHKELESIYLKSSLNWRSNEDEVKQWFKEFMLQDEAFAGYNEHEKPSYADDKEYLTKLVKGFIFQNESIADFLEKSDIRWSENKAIIKSLITKTIKGINQEESAFELSSLSYNWEEDLDFFEKMFDETLQEKRDFDSLIAEKAKNWAVERIAATDKILLKMAIQEMINFPGIPVKVTINEYIEISKKYSTPKSKQFVNGVLDVIALDLQEQGVIKKSGRGLIDNK